MSSRDRYAAAITCIDGRFQMRTLEHLQTRLGARHVDNITTAGAVRHLAGTITPEGEGLLADLAISVDKHSTQQVAVVAHADCAGNPIPDTKQKEQLPAARRVLQERFPGLEVVTLFLDPRTGFERVF